MVGADALFAALDNPRKANAKLLEAAKHHKETVSFLNNHCGN